MNNHTLEPSASPRWLHALAVATACATMVLLALGAVVTTLKVGMADPIWPTYPWHLLLISWQEPRPGFLIEHTHRAAGYFVGCCVILLAIGLWRWQPRRWLRWLGVLALAGVIVQGLLGGFRVRLNALLGTDLALIHGCFAQLVFGLLVSLAWLTSQSGPALTARTEARSGLRRWSLGIAGLIYLQLVLGGIVRHVSSPLGQRGHLLLAFAVVAAVAWLAKSVYTHYSADRPLKKSVTFLAVFIGLQLPLGIEAWMIKFASGSLPELQAVTVTPAILRTAHFLLGSAIFATSVVVALQARRQPAQTLQQVRVPVCQLEGVA
jgi:cytochrome c oxidase assembly protein subunit 15